MFEEVQKVKVAVYDLDNNTPDLGDDDFLGQVECTLGQVMQLLFYFELIIIHWTDIVGHRSLTLIFIPPQTLFVVGYTVFTLSVLACVLGSVRNVLLF